MRNAEESEKDVMRVHTFYFCWLPDFFAAREEFNATEKTETVFLSLFPCTGSAISKRMPEQVRRGAQRRGFKTAELSSGPRTGECGLPRAGRVTTSCQEYSKYSAMKYATVSEVCGL